MRITIHYRKLKEYLLERGYAEHEARSAIRKLRRLEPEIKKAFFRWFLRDVRPELTVEGVAFDELVRHWGMSEINAFLTLDWLGREPLRAKAALSRPVDHVVTTDAVRERILDSAPSGSPLEEPEDTEDLTLDNTP